MENPFVNYKKIIADTVSNHFNVRDEYKNNTVEENVEICKSDRLPFSVGMINVTGELNIGMALRTASLLGTENFYIFGRRKFDKRSTVGAEKYINIVQQVYDDPINSDEDMLNALRELGKTHRIFLCEHGGRSLGSFQWKDYTSPVKGITPLFLFGSESHGINKIIIDNPLFDKVSIPQKGVLRSYNVSAAMAIVCWDYIKEVCL